MGEPKGLVSVGDHSWLEAQLKQFSAIGLKNIVLVLGFESEKYEAALPALQKPDGLNLSIAKNSQPEFGPFSSLITGYRSISRASKACFFLPIDVPCPDKNVWETLGNHLKEGMNAAIPSIKKHGGHPVLLSASFLEKLSQISFDNKEARLDLQILKLPKDRIAYVNVADSKIHMNLNTSDDFKCFKFVASDVNPSG